MSSAVMNKAIASAQRIYIDANIIIYFMEGDDEKQEKAAALFEFAATSDITVITSEIARAECLYGVYKAGKEALVDAYNRLFDDAGLFQFVPVELEICEAAAMTGAQNRLKLIDAIHFASAIEVKCDVFVTNDKGIRSGRRLRVVQLSEL